MVNAFVEFVKDYRKKNPSLSYKDAMKEAAKVYKRSDASAAPKKKVKVAEANVKMEISDAPLPKKDRQKKVKKYKKLAKDVEDDLSKSRITPKQFNEYVILANVLAGKSQKNAYARHLKMVRRKLNTKKLKPLKEKLEKAKKDSDTLIDLLDKQKAANIKRPLKTQSKYTEEQNKMNRYRKILGEKITAFNKDPKNKGKALPRAKLEKEAEEEAEEVIITETIEGNLAKIATGKTLKYAEAYREWKKNNPKGTKTTFKPVYANMKKMYLKSRAETFSASPSRTVSGASTPSRTVSRTKSASKKKEDTDTGEETEVVEGDDKPKKKKSKTEKPKLTAQQQKNLKERKEEVKASLEEMFVAMGRPDNAKLQRYVRQLETIQRKDPDADADLDDILEKFQNLFDNVADIRAATKPVRKKLPTPQKKSTTTVGGKKPKSKEVLTDTDDDSPPSSPKPAAKPAPKKIKKTQMFTFKNRYGESQMVRKDVRDFIKKELQKEVKGEHFMTEADKLKIAYIRNYSDNQFKKEDGSSPMGTSKKAINAMIDSWESGRFANVGITGLTDTPIPPPAAASGSESGSSTHATISEKAYNMTKKYYDQLDELEKRYGEDRTSLSETSNLMESPEFGLYAGTPEQRLEALSDFLKALDTAGKKNEIMKTLDVGGVSQTFNIQKVIVVAYNTILKDITDDIDGGGATSGEGFAGVEPINSEADLEDAKGGALVDMIHRKLIKNNPNVSKQKEVDDNDKVYVKLNKEVYEKPDNRKANLEGLTYVASQSDKENAVYQSQKEKKIVIVFRGSARLKDLKADLGIATGRLHKTSRHDSTEELVKKMKALYPEYKIILTGHSLGGSLAISMSGRHDLPAVVFNAGHTIGKDNKESDITYYTKEGDPVSMLGANSYKNVKMIEGSHKNPIKDHSLNNFEGGSLLGKDPATYSPNPLELEGGALVSGIKSKLMEYAKENSKVKKALLLRDVYKLVKRIKNEGFKMNMLNEVGKIALDFNDLL